MTRWVQRLLIANVAMYFITQLVPELTTQLMLVPILIAFRPWTIITYMFLHAGLMHLIFNMIGLYFFGPRLEGRLGGRQFLWLYLLSGITGAILSFPFTPRVAIVGASGAVFGVLMGFALYWPRERIYIWGVLPVEARVLVAVLTVVSLYLGWQGGGNVAHFAHLGGFLGGFLYLKFWERRSPAAQFRAKAQPKVKKNVPNSAADIARWQRIRRDDMHPVNSEELDRILDKIGAGGVSSLTPDEREFLERFSAR
jgi:membrane associated rhomboid family serine protease